MTSRPQRMCAACRSHGDKADFFRIVASPEGAVLDERQKLPGRGAYLCRAAACIAKARRAKTLNRALKIAVPETFYAQLEDRLNG